MHMYMYSKDDNAKNDNMYFSDTGNLFGINGLKIYFLFHF